MRWSSRRFATRCPSGTSRRCSDAGVATIGDPKLDVGDLPAEGEDLAFTIEVGVRPKAELGDYTGLEVGRPALDVPDESVDAEIERIREGFGSLQPVERPAAAGDAVVIDFEGTIDGEPFEGSACEGFRDRARRRGSAAGVRCRAGRCRSWGRAHGGGRLPRRPPTGGDSPARRPASRSRSRRCGRRTCPSLDDEFASEASEFDTLDELRESIRTRVAAALEQRSEAEFREAAVDAVAANAKLDIPHDLVHARAHEMWERIERQLASRGIDPQAYAQMQGKDRHDLIDDAEQDAERTLRREATLEAVADAEGIEAER